MENEDSVLPSDLRGHCKRKVAEDQWAAAALRGGPQVSYPHQPIVSRGLLSHRLSVVSLPDSRAPSESIPWLGRLPLAPGCPPPTQMLLLC